MKVLMLNGSPRENGNTMTALREMEKIFLAEGIETETIQVGSMNIRGCLACGGCHATGKCVIDDGVNEISQKLREADGLVIGSPVHYAAAAPALVACLDRIFYSADYDTTMKVGAAVCAARRGGITATYDQLNKYFGISGMVTAGGQYWNGIHGRTEGEALQDAEGLQMMRTLARNMVFLMRSITLGREQLGLPEKEPRVATNFIR